MSGAFWLGADWRCPLVEAEMQRPRRGRPYASEDAARQAAVLRLAVGRRWDLRVNRDLDGLNESVGLAIAAQRRKELDLHRTDWRGAARNTRRQSLASSIMDHPAKSAQWVALWIQRCVSLFPRCHGVSLRTLRADVAAIRKRKLATAHPR